MNEFSLSSTVFDNHDLLSGQYWGELRIFAEVAKAKSFNRAAEKLGMSQPTISRKVRHLQDQIGSQLFVSTKNGVKLTKRGEELAAVLIVLDQSLFSITSDLKARARDVEGIVRISITDGMAAFFAVPHVTRLSEKHPKIQLHFKNMGNLNDLRDNQTDMMLAFSENSRADVVCRRLGSLHFIPIATKGYIASHGLPTADALADHLFLQSHLYESDVEVWKSWQSICAKGRIAHFCDNSFAYAMMVKAGLGIGFLGSYTVKDPEAVPLELGVRATLPLYAIGLTERLASRPVRVVFDWLCEAFGESNPWLQSQLKLAPMPEHFGPLQRFMKS